MKFFKRKKAESKSSIKVITTGQNGFYSYDGRLYKSDIIRASIRPEITAVGKLNAKHIRETEKDGEKNIEVNPDVYMRFLLEEPNQYMTGQDMQEKLASQLVLNGNAFALIVRDMNDIPAAIYPIPCNQVEALTNEAELQMEFTLKGGGRMKVNYRDIIHIKKDYGESYIFGTSPAQTLSGLMEMVGVMDQGLVKAIKNSGIVRWLLRFNTSLRSEDIKLKVEEFVKNYLDY